MSDLATAAQEHLCIIKWRLEKFEYTHCDECGEELPFYPTLDWTTEELIRTSREHDVRLHWSFVPIDAKAAGSERTP